MSTGRFILLAAAMTAIATIFSSIINVSSPPLVSWLFQDGAPKLEGAFREAGRMASSLSESDGKLEITFKPGKETILITNSGNKPARNLRISVNLTLADKFVIESVDIPGPYDATQATILPNLKSVVASIDLLPVSDTVQLILIINLSPENLDTLNKLNGQRMVDLELPVNIPMASGTVQIGGSSLRGTHTSTNIKPWIIAEVTAICDGCSTLSYLAPMYVWNDPVTPTPPPVTPFSGRS